MIQHERSSRRLPSRRNFLLAIGFRSLARRVEAGMTLVAALLPIADVD